MISGIDQGLVFEQLYLILEWVPDLVGCIGASIVLIAYALLQTKHISADSFNYLILNVIGAVLILISLVYAWNLAAVVMEFAWMIISLVGLFKFKRNQQRIVATS
jgi:hypothetical protein